MSSFPPKIKILLILAKSFWKIEIELFLSVLFLVKTRACLKFFVHYCSFEWILAEAVDIKIFSQFTKKTYWQNLSLDRGTWLNKVSTQKYWLYLISVNLLVNLLVHFSKNFKIFPNIFALTNVWRYFFSYIQDVLRLTDNLNFF